MRLLSALLLLACSVFSCSASPSSADTSTLPPLLAQQIPAGAKRVAYALQQRGTAMRQLLAQHKESENSGFYLLLLAGKQEKNLQLYTAPRSAPQAFRLLAEYPVCAASGDLGTKRMEGDRQVPEGVYRLNHLNPESRFFLSLGINYPNEIDVQRAKKERQSAPLGGEIYIHGDCVSIGCLAMGDQAIMDIYLLALWAQRIQPVQVVILPTLNLDKTEVFAPLLAQYPQEKENWTRLRTWLVQFRKNIR